MTTERPDARKTLRPVLRSVPTPRTGIPTGFGVTGGTPRVPTATPPAADVERRSRAVTLVAVLLAVVAVVAVAVAFRILVPTATSSVVAPATAAQREPQTRPGSVVDFGQVFSYGDGLDVAVNAPQQYEPSVNATGVEQGVPSKVQVVITNRTAAPFRPNTLEVRATSGGQEAVAVWDPDQGVGLTGPDVSIPAGATLQFYLAFAPVDPSDLRLEITPAIYGYGAMVVQRP